MQQTGIEDPSEDQIFDYGLYLINQMLHEAGTSLENFPPMPIPEGNWNLLFGSRLIAEQQNYNRQQEQELAVEDVNKMNVGQKHTFDSIIDSVIHQRKKLFL